MKISTDLLTKRNEQIKIFKRKQNLIKIHSPVHREMANLYHVQSSKQQIAGV